MTWEAAPVTGHAAITYVLNREAKPVKAVRSPRLPIRLLHLPFGVIGKKLGVAKEVRRCEAC